MREDLLRAGLFQCFGGGASTGVYGAGRSLPGSLLEINTIRAAAEMAVVAAAGGITPDRGQTLNALLDEFQQALESGVMENSFGQRFPLWIYHYADMQRWPMP